MSKRDNPYSTVTIEVSYRMHDSGGPCAFVTCIVDEKGKQRSLRSSRHLSGPPERLVDLVMDEVRQRSLEEWLTLASPF